MVVVFAYKPKERSLLHDSVLETSGLSIVIKKESSRLRSAWRETSTTSEIKVVQTGGFQALFNPELPCLHMVESQMFLVQYCAAVVVVDILNDHMNLARWSPRLTLEFLFLSYQNLILSDPRTEFNCSNWRVVHSRIGMIYLSIIIVQRVACTHSVLQYLSCAQHARFGMEAHPAVNES